MDVRRTGEGRTAALIPAAGAGQRLGAGPKALLRLQGVSLVARAVALVRPLVDEVWVAVPPGRANDFRAEVGDGRIVEGGGTRQESVERLLEASTAEWLLLHDAARPFASPALCRQVLDAARQAGFAGAFVASEVPVLVRQGEGGAYERRNEALLFQTPQAYSREVLTQAYAKARASRAEYSSTALLAMAAGCAPVVVPGEKRNFKITTAEDWEMATALAAADGSESGRDG